MREVLQGKGKGIGIGIGIEDVIVTDIGKWFAHSGSGIVTFFFLLGNLVIYYSLSWIFFVQLIWFLYESQRC